MSHIGFSDTSPWKHECFTVPLVYVQVSLCSHLHSLLQNHVKNYLHNWSLVEKRKQEKGYLIPLSDARDIVLYVP